MTRVEQVQRTLADFRASLERLEAALNERGDRYDVYEKVCRDHIASQRSAIDQMEARNV